MGSKIPFIVFAVIFVGSLLFFMYVNRSSGTDESNDDTTTPNEGE